MDIKRLIGKDIDKILQFYRSDSLKAYSSKLEELNAIWQIAEESVPFDYKNPMFILFAQHQLASMATFKWKSLFYLHESVKPLIAKVRSVCGSYIYDVELLSAKVEGNRVYILCHYKNILGEFDEDFCIVSIDLWLVNNFSLNHAVVDVIDINYEQRAVY